MTKVVFLLGASPQKNELCIHSYRKPCTLNYQKLCILIYRSHLSNKAVASTSSSSILAQSAGILFVVIMKEVFSYNWFIKLNKFTACLFSTGNIITSICKVFSGRTILICKHFFHFFHLQNRDNYHDSLCRR
jgi:hypothetical protein